MRLAVILAAVSLKLYFRLRLMTRETVALIIAGVLFLALAMTIKVERKHKPPRHELYCAEASQKYEAEELCEWKLRSVRIRASRPHEGSLA